MRPIPRPHFQINIYLFQTDFFLSKIYDKCDDFDLDTVIFSFLDGAFPALPLTVFTFLNLFGLAGHQVTSLTSMLVIKL